MNGNFSLFDFQFKPGFAGGEDVLDLLAVLIVDRLDSLAINCDFVVGL